MKLAESGKIRDIKKTIARVEGLPSCLNGQIVDMGDGVRGIVMGFDEDDVLVLVLGDESKMRLGREVSGVNEPFTIPVGGKFIGRMINALAEPCDGKAIIIPDAHNPVFRDSPSIVDRSPVDQFLPVGTKVMDIFVPLGKGQRQLIIGDRMSGKTVVALDAIINQKGRGVICIYCSIGKSMSSLEKALSALQAGGALDYSIIMIALDNAPVGEQYILPYAAVSMGDYFTQQGRDVLIVFDDITKHAWAYRQLSLLLERPPGREAYPGDIFYVHTQLMERAGRFNKRCGGGTMTFLGIAETLEGDLTGYIPSNLISMCDGLVFLSGTLFGEGIRPAIDFSLSVSIIGGRTQPPALKSLSSSLRVQYAQYTEVAKLSKLQSSVSAEAEKVLKRGKAITAVLQQGQYKPVTLAEEVLLLYAVNRGLLDNISDDRQKAFVGGIYGFAFGIDPEFSTRIDEKTELDSELERLMDSIVSAYFAANTGEAEAPAGAGN